MSCSNPQKEAEMPIADRNLGPGTKLVGKYKGDTFHAELVETAEGLRYRLEDGREFKSPSSAGSAVMGGKSCNGWAWWSIATAQTTAPSTSTPEAAEPATAAAPSFTEAAPAPAAKSAKAKG